MDEDHLMAAFRYIALNPVKANLVSNAQDWPWSSAAAHIARTDSVHVRVEPGLERIADFAAFVSIEPDAGLWSNILKAELIGRPVGAKPQKRGPKPKGGGLARETSSLFDDV